MVRVMPGVGWHCRVGPRRGATRRGGGLRVCSPAALRRTFLTLCVLMRLCDPAMLARLGGLHLSGKRSLESGLHGVVVLHCGEASPSAEEACGCLAAEQAAAARGKFQPQ